MHRNSPAHILGPGRDPVMVRFEFVLPSECGAHVRWESQRCPCIVYCVGSRLAYDNMYVYIGGPVSPEPEIRGWMEAAFQPPDLWQRGFACCVRALTGGV